jgi:hypothetical protein
MPVDWWLAHGLRVSAHMVWRASAASGVGVGDGLAKGFEFGDEDAQAALVVEPGLVVGELVLGEDAGDGLVGDLTGPLMVGAVQVRGRRGSGITMPVISAPERRDPQRPSIACKQTLH